MGDWQAALSPACDAEFSLTSEPRRTSPSPFLPALLMTSWSLKSGPSSRLQRKLPPPSRLLHVSGAVPCPPVSPLGRSSQDSPRDPPGPENEESCSPHLSSARRELRALGTPPSSSLCLSLPIWSVR